MATETAFRQIQNRQRLRTLLKKSTSTKNYYICLCKPFWNLHEKQTRTALPTKSVEIILTAIQNIEKYLQLPTIRKLFATETPFRQTQNRQLRRTLLKKSTSAKNYLHLFVQTFLEFAWKTTTHCFAYTKC